MILGLAHVCFVVSDLDASIAFYEDQLGLTHAFDFVNEQGARFGCYLRVGGRAFLELFTGTLATRAEGQTFQHLCLEVDDIEATVATLRERGVAVGPVSMGADNSWQAWLSDPDGNRIELHGYTPESWQTPWVQ